MKLRDWSLSLKWGKNCERTQSSAAKPMLCLVWVNFKQGTILVSAVTSESLHTKIGSSHGSTLPVWCCEKCTCGRGWGLAFCHRQGSGCHCWFLGSSPSCPPWRCPAQELKYRASLSLPPAAWVLNTAPSPVYTTFPLEEHCTPEAEDQNLF